MIAKTKTYKEAEKIYKHTSKTREKAANVFDWSLKNKDKQGKIKGNK